jgi:hypothetical protein
MIPKEQIMIPHEIAVIASLIWAAWADLPDEDRNEIVNAAYRIYDAGYRRTRAADSGKQELEV